MTDSTPWLHPKSERALKQIVQHPPHALLIASPHGDEQRVISQWLAETLLGDGPSTHAVHHLEPNEKGNITIEYIHELERHIHHKSSNAGRIEKIVLIQHAEYMTIEAQNALLKLLEEPVDGVMYILTTASREALLPTIRSRTQHAHIHPIDKATALKYLQKAGVDGELATKLHLAARGSGTRLKRFIENDSLRNESFAELADVRNILSMNTFERLISATAATGKRQHALEFIEKIELLTQIAARRAQKPSDAEHWLFRLELIEKTSEALRKNGNIKLAIDRLLISY